MDEIKLELSDEQIEQFARAVEKLAEAFREVAEIFAELAQQFLEMVLAFAEQLGRFFLKMQLLEWRISPRWADLISQKVPRYWAVRLGFDWFRRKVCLN